jgi:hypothetical protein
MDPKPFPLQIGSFLGIASGGHHRLLWTPSQPHLFGGEGHAPVVAVLLALGTKGRQAHLRP